ncbi:MAG TPA: GIDE domain-containing protein, partial [Candidatus Binataceae bacterium]|nr:GIDE domain-containing protein [Candidatus Binataceae bacterium]
MDTSYLDIISLNHVVESLCIASGIRSIVQGFKDINAEEEIEFTPVSNARSAAMGFVKLKGIARFAELVESPFSKRSCCWWLARLEVHGKGGWNELIGVDPLKSQALFFLEDETGRVLVDARTMEIHVSTSAISYPQTDFSITDSRIGNLAPSWLRYLDRGRVAEILIEEGCRVFVSGELSIQDTQLIIRSGAGNPAYLSDADNLAILKG